MTDRTSFPAWEPWMDQFVSQDDYSKLVNVCVVECSKDPPVNEQLSEAAFLSIFMSPCLCMFTLPVACCLSCYVEQQEKAKNKLLGENVAATGVEGVTFVAHRTKTYASDGWFDHRGTQLFESSGQRHAPGRPAAWIQPRLHHQDPAGLASSAGCGSARAGIHGCSSHRRQHRGR